MKRLLGILLLLASGLAGAANHYIRDGATGVGACTDWTTANACDQLPATLVRGDTYYVAGGSYPGRTFNTAASGTTPITIKGATAADHGTATGWVASYGVDVTQATWTSTVTFNTSYWVFDGSVGPIWSRTPSQYGFTFSAMRYPVEIWNLSAAITNFTVAHIAATAPSTDVEKFFVSTDNSTKAVSNVTITNNYLNGWQNGYWATSAGLTMDAWVWQYNMCLNGYSSATNHGEWINNNGGLHTNQVTRWNWFEGQQNGTGVIVANNNNNQAPKIYGNVFYNISEGNGLITGTSAGNMVSPEVYNNTFYGNSGGGWMGSNITGTPIVRNNIICNQNAGSSVAGDYNAYFNTTNAPSEAHGQTGATCPIVAAGTNFHLSGVTTAGLTLAAPYNVDVDGVTRGSSGVWDRGAFEYLGGITPTTPLAFINAHTWRDLVAGPTQYSLLTNVTFNGALVTDDPGPLTLGMRFRSSVAGQAVGAKYYRMTGVTGTHVCGIYTNAGALLTSQTLTGETATGWQSVTFTTPATIAANTDYKVACFFPTAGKYAATSNGFASQITNSPLSSTAPNGLYTYAASLANPTSTFSASQYWVDVIFQ